MEVKLCLYLSFLTLIADNITAQRDLWLVGDVFLSEIFHTMPAMCRQAKIDKNHLTPYLYDEYNLTAHYTSKMSLLKNTAARSINCLIEVINKHRLPKMIIFIPDKDFVMMFCREKPTRTQQGDRENYRLDNSTG